jgi:hypothetical protein
MLNIYNCEIVGKSIAIRKEWQNQAQFQLETESWSQVVATDQIDHLLSVTSDPPTKST